MQRHRKPLRLKRKPSRCDSVTVFAVKGKDSIFEELNENKEIAASVLMLAAICYILFIRSYFAGCFELPSFTF